MNGIWDIKVISKRKKILAKYDKGANWTYVFVRGGWHLHDGKLCNDCLVMASF